MNLTMNVKIGTLLTIVAMAFSACSDETLYLGDSLTDSTDKLDVTTQVFPITTQTMKAGRELAFTSECYLGKVMDPETGTYVTSEFTTQFSIPENVYISPEKYISSIHDGTAGADSCEIVLFLEEPFSSQDSLIAMKMKVMELATPAEEGTRYYTDHDPISEKLVREGGLTKNKLFTCTNLNDRDSNHVDVIRIPLNEAYTDKDGKTYNNYGTYLMQQYYQHREYFNNSYAFSHHVCPGFYFHITDGLGFHAKVSDMALCTYYQVQLPDTAYHALQTLAGTREVMQTSFVSNDQSALDRLANDQSCTYLKSPAGLYTEVTLPIADIKGSHENDSILTASVRFQRINNQTDNSRVLDSPQAVLMVQKDSLNAFFEGNKSPDGYTADLSLFNDGENTYDFTNISNLITTMWKKHQEGMKADSNWETLHPDWNKVVLVPITITYGTTSTSTTITGVTHDMSLTSTRLVGGQHSPIQMNVVYAKFKQ